MPLITRRAFATQASAAALVALGGVSAAWSLPAASRPTVTMHKDPSCGCCTGWARHLERAGFTVRSVDSADMIAVKARLGVPEPLQSCHTAEIAGYVVEGHVPVSAIERLIAEAPNATGLAAPGMPIGSPGMEGGPPEVYEVVLFGPGGPRLFGRFRGSAPV